LFPEIAGTGGILNLQLLQVKKKISYGKRKNERPSGLLVIIISFLVIASILTQLDVKPNYSNLADDLSFLSENLIRLKINAFLWLFNSVMIILLGPAVLITFLPYKRTLPYSAAFLISATGIIYFFYSGTCFNIISLVGEYSSSPENEKVNLSLLAFNMLINKTNLQLLAFTLTGISSVVLGSFITWTGYLPRLIGVMSVAGGLIYTVFGWIDPENLVFSAGRVLFVLSLLLFGIYLLLRGTRIKKAETVTPP
jgi:hypothetical protein